jgi:hypothetical protein
VKAHFVERVSKFLSLKLRWWMYFDIKIKGLGCTVCIDDGNGENKVRSFANGKLDESVQISLNHVFASVQGDADFTS